MLQTAILCTNKLTLVMVLLLLHRPGPMQSFDAAQVEALVSTSLRLHEYGFGIGLVFFGVSCLITGYLLFRSKYFPRTLGILQAMAGVSYLINSFALLLSPALASKLFPAIVLPAFIGELATCLWLLVKGLNVSKWDERKSMEPVIESPAEG